MANPLRGTGLFIAHDALAALEEDPQRLERSRRRFSGSPPSPSGLSHNSTLTTSPNAMTEEQELRENRKAWLRLGHQASFPYSQYDAQTREERTRIVEAIKNGKGHVPVGVDPSSVAHELVKKRWIEQGIWKDEWSSPSWVGPPDGLWKHQEPLEPGSDSEPDSEPEPRPNLIWVPQHQQQPAAGAKRLGADEKEEDDDDEDEEMRAEAERRAARRRDREASRPFHQFLYQVSEERGRILEDPEQQAAYQAARRQDWEDLRCFGRGSSEECERIFDKFEAGTVPDDINARAYEAVRATWVRRGIWDKRWGVLPGMTWKHEAPWEELVRQELGDTPPPAGPEAAGQDAPDAPDTPEVQGPDGPRQQTPASVSPCLSAVSYHSAEPGAPDMPLVGGASSYGAPSYSMAEQGARLFGSNQSWDTPGSPIVSRGGSPVGVVPEAEPGPASPPPPPPITGGASRHATHLLQAAEVTKARGKKGPAGRQGRPRKVAGMVRALLGSPPPAVAPEADGGADGDEPDPQAAPPPRRRSKRLQDRAEAEAKAARQKAGTGGGTGAANGSKPRGVTKRKAPGVARRRSPR